jgi:hypothetical protein
MTDLSLFFPCSTHQLKITIINYQIISSVMIVLVITVLTKAMVSSDTSSFKSSSDLLQTDRGNSQQEDTVDIGHFFRELKNKFSAVIESHFGISSVDCMLLDSPPAVVLRNYERSLPEMNKLTEIMSFVIEFLKEHNYLKSIYRVAVKKILHDQSISEFFFSYYVKARSVLHHSISPESRVNQFRPRKSVCEISFICLQPQRSNLN